MCAMHEPVQHDVGDGGIADVLVPVLHGHLAGGDGGGQVMPVIYDLHEIAALLGGERRNRPTPGGVQSIRRQ